MLLPFSYGIPFMEDYCFLNIDKINNSGSTGSAQCICLTSQSNSRFYHICTIVTVSALVVNNNIFTCETSFIPKYFSTWQVGETHTLKKVGEKKGITKASIQ